MKHKSNENNKHLLSAATVLVEKLSDPAEFIYFLVKSMDAVKELESKYPDLKKHDSASSITMLIKELLPAFTGDSEKRMDVTEGLKSFMDDFGYECLQQALGSIMMAFGHANIEEGHGGPEYQAKELSSINVLFEMAHHLYYYEQERLNEKQAA